MIIMIMIDSFRLKIFFALNNSLTLKDFKDVTHADFMRKKTVYYLV